MALELTMDDCQLSDITKIGIKKIIIKKTTGTFYG
jgi:hypothetical protein